MIWQSVTLHAVTMQLGRRARQSKLASELEIRAPCTALTTDHWPLVAYSSTEEVPVYLQQAASVECMQWLLVCRRSWSCGRTSDCWTWWNRSSDVMSLVILSGTCVSRCLTIRSPTFRGTKVSFLVTCEHSHTDIHRFNPVDRTCVYDVAG